RGRRGGGPDESDGGQGNGSGGGQCSQAQENSPSFGGGGAAALPRGGRRRIVVRHAVCRARSGAALARRPEDRMSTVVPGPAPGVVRQALSRAVTFSSRASPGGTSRENSDSSGFGSLLPERTVPSSSASTSCTTAVSRGRNPPLTPGG